MLAPIEGGLDRSSVIRESNEPMLRLVTGGDVLPSEILSLSPRIAGFFEATALDSPCLVMDVDLVGGDISPHGECQLNAKTGMHAER